MPPQGGSDWTTYLQTGGTVGLLTLAIVAFSRDWIVTKATHQAAIKERDDAISTAVADRDFYRGVLFESLGLQKRQMTAAEQLAGAMAEHRDKEDRLQDRINILTQQRGEAGGEAGGGTDQGRTGRPS